LGRRLIRFLRGIWIREGILGALLKGIMMNKKLCLGTAQFGLDYGVANKNGKPSLERAFEMLDFAFENGIKWHDTAQAYGNAEEVLGEYLAHRGNLSEFHIISKLFPKAFDDVSECVFKDIKEAVFLSLKKLNIKDLDGFLFHTPEYIYREDLVEQMIRVREKGLVRNIGVSIYETNHALDAAQMEWVDYIQVPYSVFDQRLSHSEFFELTRRNNKKVFARSAFLQGLTLMSVSDIPEGLESAKGYIEELAALCRQYGLSRLEVSELFSLNDERIDFFVFGGDSVQQLKEVVEVSENEDLPESLKRELREKFADIERSLIMPNLWEVK